MAGLNLCKFIPFIRQVQFSFIPSRFAGHSKWANIRHIKAQKDGEKSQKFSAFTRRIRVAIQEHGSADPAVNLALSQAIDTAKKNNMPVSSIQQAIKSSQIEKSKIQEHVLEIKGPKGCMILALTSTDNIKKTRETIASILRKHNASYVTTSLKHIFDEKGVILTSKPENTDSDKAMEHAIEAGAEDVIVDEPEGMIQFLCHPDSLALVRSKLEKFSYDISDADKQFIPNSMVELAESDLESVSKLYEKLESHPNVVKLFDNIA